MPHHTANEVASLLGLSLAEVRRCARAGFLTAKPDADGEVRFSFQDLVVLRQAVSLMSGRIRPHRVRAALTRLREQLSDGRPLSGLDVSSEGHRIIVGDGQSRWEPMSGQLQLDFQGRRESAPVSVARAAVNERTAVDHYERALELEESGLPGAESEYEKALKLDPRHLHARLNLGRLLHERGQLAAAEEQYRAILKEGPHSLASFNLAVALEDQGREDDALRAYHEAIAADPNCEDAYFNLSRIYERRGERASALRALRTYRNLTRR